MTLHTHMTKYATFTLLLIVGSIFSSFGQDLHFTNYDGSPQNLNPALTGDFRGTMKVGGIYRDQFSQFFNKGYKSQGLFLEYNLNFKLFKNDWFSVGTYLDNDLSGDFSFGSTRTGLNASYHIPIGDSQIFSLGFQGVSINRNLTSANYETPNSIRGQGHGEDIQRLFQNYDKSAFDYGLGLTYSLIYNKKVSSTFGASLYHLKLSRQSLANGNLDYIPLRLNIHGEFVFLTGKSTGLRPRFFYTNSEQASEFVIQVINGFKVGKHDLEFGLGHRFNDALQFLIGFDFRGWKVNGAFDMTTSSASAYNDSFGAYEIGVYKIINILPKADMKVIQICPRL